MEYLLILKEYRMVRIGIGFIGMAIGLGLYYWENSLRQEFEEIEKEKKWPLWVLPLVNGLLSILAFKGASSYTEILIKIIEMSILLLLFVFDLKYMLLPTKVILPGVGVSLIGLILGWQRTGIWEIVRNGLLGGAIGFGIFWLIYFGSLVILKKEGLGYGDVRLMLLIGLIVGIQQVFMVIIIASLLAVLGGSIFWLIRKQSQAFPYGPFLCMGTIIMMNWGDKLMAYYFQLMGF